METHKERKIIVEVKKTNESEENQKRGFNFQQRYGFDANSWVWIIKFEPCEKKNKTNFV